MWLISSAFNGKFYFGSSSSRNFLSPFKSRKSSRESQDEAALKVCRQRACRTRQRQLLWGLQLWKSAIIRAIFTNFVVLFWGLNFEELWKYSKWPRTKSLQVIENHKFMLKTHNFKLGHMEDSNEPGISIWGHCYFLHKRSTIRQNVA